MWTSPARSHARDVLALRIEHSSASRRGSSSPTIR